MLAPRSYFFPLALIFSIFFFAFSDGGGILPVDYVYVMFILSFAIIAPFFFRRRINKNALIVALCLFILGSVSSYGSGVPSAFLYSIGPIMIILAQENITIPTTIRARKVFAAWIASTLLIIGGVSLLFMTPNYHGRLFLPHVGNPNYTAMLYLAMFISIHMLKPFLVSWCKHLPAAATVVLIYVIFATETRSVFLGLVIYIIFNLTLKRGHVKSARWGLFSLVVFTAVGQLLAYYVFTSAGVGANGRSTFSLFDASNLTRVTAFYTATLLVVSDFAFVWHGVGNVDGIWDTLAQNGDVEHVPHNWFMMMWLSNGALFTFLCLIVLLKSAWDIPSIYIPGLAAILVIALIVGRSVLFSPLCLFIISGMIRGGKVRTDGISTV